MRTQVSITTPFIKLDAFLKFSGLAGTGGHAKAMIAEGMVAVDGAPCLQRGRKLYPGAVVTITDEEGSAELEVIAGAD